MYLERTSVYHRVPYFVLKKDQVYLGHGWQFFLNLFYKLLKTFRNISMSHLPEFHSIYFECIPNTYSVYYSLQIQPDFFQSHTQQTTDVCPLSNSFLYAGRLLESKLFDVIEDALCLNLLKISHNLEAGRTTNLPITITWPYSPDS